MMNTQFNLEGKKAIVTGGSSGLGNSMAEGLLKGGAKVVIIDLSPRTCEAAGVFKEAGYDAGYVIADLGTSKGRKDAFEEALSLLEGKLDIIVNAAGIQKRHPSEAFPLKDWESVLNVNLTAVFELCQLAGNVMLSQGSGKIINIASMLSFFGGYTVPAYAASKGGVAQLTKALANEWASKGIHVNALAPGYMDTSMNVNLINDPDRNDEILKRIPMGRWGKPLDMQGPVQFLASEASDYVNGAVIPVDGGYLGR